MLFDESVARQCRALLAFDSGEVDLTYLTAVPSGNQLAIYEDIYRKDGAPPVQARVAAR